MRRTRGKPVSRRRRKRKASTEEVLGTPMGKGEQIRPKYKQYYDRLVDLRDRLLGQQQELTRDAAEERPAFSLHMADAGTDTYDRDWALSMLSSEQDSVYQIDQALDRIRNNTYGICELTGKPIEPERLEAIPWTRFSAGAELELERSGAERPLRRLQPREAVRRESAGTADELD